MSTYYLVLGGSILIGVGAQVALKVGTAGSDSIATQFTRPAVLVGLALAIAGCGGSDGGSGGISTTVPGNKRIADLTPAHVEPRDRALARVSEIR